MLLFAAALPLHGENGVGAAPPPPDAGLYTTYELGSSNTVIWGVCGSVFGGDGCVRGGSLGPFGKVGAMMETSAFFDMSTDTVTRWIYVVDIGSGSAHNGVRLYVYKKTDAFAGGKYVPSVTSVTNIPLPLVGGNIAKCFMAANFGFLFIGTEQSQQAVKIQKSTLAVTDIGGTIPPTNVTGITANNYGFVTVCFGGNGCFAGGGGPLYGPDGSPKGTSSGLMLNSITGADAVVLP